MIKLVDIHKSFIDGKKENTILNGVDLSIGDEEFITIMGTSGSGKSTLLSIIALLLKPTAGTVIYDGQEVDFTKEKKIDSLRREKVGLVFQNANLIECLNPMENILLAMNSKESYSKKVKRVLDLLDLVGIADKSKSNIKSLSGGEAQRVAIVRALINQPRVLLCDEPTGALDKDTGEKVIELLRETQKKTRCSLVIVTHNDGIGDLGDRKITLKGGYSSWNG